jgi:hypothetical protein
MSIPPLEENEEEKKRGRFGPPGDSLKIATFFPKVLKYVTFCNIL